MIAVQNVSKRFGGRVLFTEVAFRIGIDDRVALVGPNGVGKTTLLEMIAGRVSPDSGSIAINKNAGIGYLTQDIETRSGQTALEAVLTFRSDLAGIEHHLRVLEEEIASASSDEGEALLNRYGELQARYEQLGGYSREARAREILGGLGFNEAQMASEVESLSGGWRMRTALAGLLLSAPDILLLDEPTNHLDLESVIWVEEFLLNYPGAILLISHDRSFMNRLVSRVIELDGISARNYTGNYDRFIEAREQGRLILESTAKNQQKKIVQTQAFIDRFRSKATKARQVQSRVRMLEKMDRVQIGKKQKKVRFRFPVPPRSGKTVIRLENLDKSYGDHVVYRGLNLELQRGERIALVGPNGAGKSTLLKLLAGEISHEKGKNVLGHNVTRGYYAQHQLEQLKKENTVLEEIIGAAPMEEESFLRAILGRFLFTGDDAKKKVGVLSGGERSRLALAKMLIRPMNFLLMDEPTNHLDIASRDVLEEALKNFSGTLCFITHDRHFIRSVSNRVIEILDGKVTVFPDDYDYYLFKKGQEKEKMEGEVELSSGKTLGLQDGVPGESRPKTRKTREQKRAEAELRNKRYQKTNLIKKNLKKAETEVSRLEAEIKKYNDVLADPELYQDPTKFSGTMKAHKKSERHLKELNVEWEKLSAELVKMEES